MTEGQTRHQAGRLILFSTLWLTLFVLSVEVSAAWATRSLSLMAESLHTLLTSFSTLVGLLTLTSPDRPTGQAVYGHGKREAVLTFLLIAVLGFAGLSLLGVSIGQLTATMRGEPLTPVLRVSSSFIQILAVVAGTCLSLALLSLYEARVHRSPILRLNGTQLLWEVGLALLVIVGLVAIGQSLSWLDGVLAILLVLLVVIRFWRVVSWQLPLLVQQTAIAPEVLAQVAHEVGGVTHCYQILSRGIVGRLVYVQMHLIVHPEFVEITSQIAEHIQEALQERYGPIQVTFYIDDVVEPSSLNHSGLRSEINGKHNPLGE